MTRVMVSILVLLLLGGFYGLYSLSLKVRELQQQTAQLERATIVEQEAIRVLKAEWAYLNRPDYLQELSDRVGLVDVVPVQFGRFSDLPYRPLPTLSDHGNPIVLPRLSPRLGGSE